MPIKQVVFVQGGKKNEEHYPWMFFHFHPTTDLDPGAVDLVFFDYPAGKLKTWKSHRLFRGSAPSATPDTEVDLAPKVRLRRSDGSLDRGPERASVLALYDWVKAQRRGSIASLQVFSHGWRGGPIVWNSYELGPGGTGIDHDLTLPRDRNDTEFRLRDFHGSNPLAGADGRAFAGAFASDALIKLWGCVAPRGVRGHVRRFVRAPRGSRGDAARKAHLGDYLDLVGSSFAMEMANRLDLRVWAAPLGWGSIPTRDVPFGNNRRLRVRYRGHFPPDLTRDQWWRVSWYFRNQDKGVEFYRDTLGARVDATDFVEHHKRWFDDAVRAATASLEPSRVPSPRQLQDRLLDRLAGAGPQVT